HGEPCERCRGGRHWQALRTGCVQESRARSAVGMVEAYLHEALHAYRHIGLRIAPSEFVMRKAIHLGVPPGQLRLLPPGLEREEEALAAGPAAAERPFVLYFGRLSVEKG